MAAILRGQCGSGRGGCGLPGAGALLIVIPLLAMLQALGSGPAGAAVKRGDVYEGKAEPVDGDTIRLGGRIFHIDGIDAPELPQRCWRPDELKRYGCGEEARKALGKLLRQGVTRCTVIAADIFGRYITQCAVNGQDIGESMVQAGWALSIGATGKKYNALNRYARENQKGIWAGKFVLPSEWRRRDERVQDEVFGGQGACWIKGNVERDGRRVYYVPYSRGYHWTRIDLSKGERWFCNTREAEKAGWKRAPN